MEGYNGQCKGRAPTGRLLRLGMLFVAVAAVAVPVTAQMECETNPTAEACASYTMEDAVLQRDLARMCAGSTLGGAAYTGWPAACTLWYECQQGRAPAASCQPLSLLQTACNESPQLEACMTYMLVCAPQSVVRQCAQQPPIRELRPAMQLHTAVQQICVGNGSQPIVSEACRSCSSQTFDPDKVTVQALQANCADPLGTLSSLCLEEQRSLGSNISASLLNGSCSNWAAFCESEAGSGFWQLCDASNSTAAARPLPAPPVAAPPPPTPGAKSPPLGSPTAPAPPPKVEAAGAGGGATEPPSCYSDPLQDRCRSFQQSNADSEADVQRLCASLPSMVGCSLWQQCSSGAASGTFCQPFSVLGSICAANPAVDGCNRWAALCTTPGSVVRQCLTAAPIRSVLSTSQALEAVSQACTANGKAVAGCEACATGATTCSDPLAVLSRLCIASPGVAQCSAFQLMCAEAGTTFRSLCCGGDRAPAAGIGIGASNSSSGTGQAPASSSGEAKPYIHAAMSAVILFKSWVPSGGAYVASCLAIIALALLALKALSLQLEARWVVQLLSPPDALTTSAFKNPEYAYGSAGKDRRRSSTASNAPMLRSSMRQSSMAHQQPPLQQVQEQRQLITRAELGRNAVRSCLTGGVVLLEYCLVLVVVTFNLGLILSATLGFCLGALIFGHIGERAAFLTASMAGGAGPAAAPFITSRTSLQPLSEGDLDIQLSITPPSGIAALPQLGCKFDACFIIIPVHWSLCAPKTPFQPFRQRCRQATGGMSGKKKPGSDLAAQNKKKLKSVDEILEKVKRLGQRVRAEPEVQKTLAELNLSHACREVVDKSADAVLDEIETSILLVAASVLRGEGFTYTLPNRAKGNQLYVPELDRIVLKDSQSHRTFANISTCRKAVITTRILQLVHELCTKRIHVTKRDLFYTDVKLFEDQGNSDGILDDLACMLGCTRSSLHVVASEKGVVVGRLTFREDGDLIDCRRMGVGGKAIPPNIDKVDSIESDAMFILLVEKDAAFMRLAEDRFYNTYPCIIITAKGQPDVATRLFLRKLKQTLRIPVLALVDSDPYGLKILSVYMKGSMNMSYDSSNLTTPDIKWLGVRPSDLDRFSIPEQCRLPMTDEDIKTGKKLLEEDFVRANPDWVKELEIMVTTKVKAEIQALSSFGFQYLSQQYLPLKLQGGQTRPEAPRQACNGGRRPEALERCIQRGMSMMESVQLLSRLGVAPKLSMIVWHRLELENKEFFALYQSQLEATAELESFHM
ncbi:DNA topoisomerase 6 subunit A [Chlorella vulgaris]